MSSKRYVCVFIFFSCILFSYSQSTNSKSLDRKGRFFFNAGPEYRITPAYRITELSREGILTNPDMQNSGLSLNLGVDFYITDRFSIGFKNSFRYDVITIDVDINSGVSQGISSSEDDFIVGYHFNLNYHFPIFKKGELLANFGISLLNRNTEFSFSETVFDSSGQAIGTITSTIDYSYSANKISVGYVNGKHRVMLGTYVTNNTGYFEETTTFWVPFVNYSFDFARL